MDQKVRNVIIIYNKNEQVPLHSLHEALEEIVKDSCQIPHFYLLDWYEDIYVLLLSLDELSYSEAKEVAEKLFYGEDDDE